MAHPSHGSRADATPYIAPVAGLLLIAGSAAAFLALADARDESRFRNARLETEDLLVNRLARHEELLLAARGFFDANGLQVSQDTFRTFVRSLELRERLPGVLGIGFSRRLRPEEVAAVEAERRRSGHPDFRVWPAGPRGEYHPIVLLEPQDRRNRAALGYDMFTEAARREAMSSARDTGAITASGRVTLVQELAEPEAEVQPGFLLYVPVYRGGVAPPDVESRREALLGFAYSPVRVGDLLRGIFGTQHQPRVELDLYDAAEPREDALLYRGITRPPQEARHRTTATITIAGRPWTLAIVSTSGFEASSGRRLIPYLIALALGLNAALFLALRGQARARAEALRARAGALAAADRTARLQSLTAALSGVVSAEEVAALVVGRIYEATSALVTALYLLDPDGRALRLRSQRGVEEAVARKVLVIPLDAPLPLSLATRTREPVWLPNRQVMLERFPEIVARGPLSVVRREASAALPLLSGGRCYGGLLIAFSEPQAFGADDREFLVAIATQCAQALERASLYEAERAARQRLVTFTEIAQRIIEAGLDLGAVLRAICVELAGRVGDACAITLSSDDGRMLELAELSDRDPASEASVRAVLSAHPVEVGGESSLARVFRTGVPVLVPVVPGGGVTPALPADYRAHLERHPITSLVVVPLRIGDRNIGTLTATRTVGSPPYTEEDQRLLQDVAGRAAFAIENARLADRLRVGGEQARLLARASAELSGSLDLQGTLTRVAQVAVPSHADWCFADLIAADGGFDRVAVAHSDPADAGLAAFLCHHYGPEWSRPEVAALLASGQVWLSGEITDALTQALVSDQEHLEKMHGMGLRSLILVPLIARGRPLGALTVASRSRVYGEQDVPFLREVAHRAALAIDNARLYEEAQQAIRLRDDFLSVAGHELRTPMAALVLHMEGLQRQAGLGYLGPVSEAVLDRLAKARKQVRRIEELITELLDVSRISAGRLVLHLERVDLHEVVEDVAARYEQELAKAGCELRLHSAPGLVGRWDRIRLEQVLSNLLSNAAKYGAGKPIELRAELGADRRAALSVRDAGIGVPLEDQARIFHRFERAVSERHYGGLGLGLWISRQIVEAMDGTIEVASAPGAGSTFTVRLPLEPRPEAEGEAAGTAHH